ncbi:MAG: hypothetical protein LQ350_003834 [Teloschistes chrysophthalmus]|nr:MAG: hypothetical protein LQ350_003834 [Niorma chrysophthalma]
MPPRRNRKAAPRVQQAPVQQPQAPVPPQAPVQPQAQAPVQPPQPPVQPARPTLIEIGVELRFRIKVSRKIYPRKPKALRQKKTAQQAVKIIDKVIDDNNDPAPIDVAPVKGARKARGAPKRPSGPKPKKEEDDNLADNPRKRKRQAQVKEESDEGYESSLPAKKKRQTKKPTRAEEGSGKGFVKPAKGRGRGKKMPQEEEEGGDPIDEPEEPQPAPQPQRRKRKLTKKEQKEEEEKKGKWVFKDLYFGPGIQGQYTGEMRPSRQEWTFEFHPWVNIAEEPRAQQAKGKAKPKKTAPKPVPQVPGVGLSLGERIDAWHDAGKKATPDWLMDACEAIDFQLEARKKGQRGKKAQKQAPDPGSDADNSEEEEDVEEEEDDEDDEDDDLDQEEE